MHRLALPIAFVLVTTLSLFVRPAQAQTLCPEDSYVGGNAFQLAADGSYVSGGAPVQLAPDGSYTSGQPRLAPNSSYVGGGTNEGLGSLGPTLCPAGTYVSGRCRLAPDGSYVGE